MTAVLTKEHRRVAGWLVVGVCAGIVVVLLTSKIVSAYRTSTKTADLVSAIRSTQKTNTSVNKTNTQLLQIINSCLTPGESCYRLGQQQRASTARGTQQSASAAAACAASLPNPTYTAVYRCLRESLHTAAHPKR